MPHPSGHCTCGRVIHLPKNVSRGDSWTCHNCGQTWIVSNHGQPLHSCRSKAPTSSSDPFITGLTTSVLVLGGLVALAVAPSTVLVGAGIAGGVWVCKQLT